MKFAVSLLFALVLAACGGDGEPACGNGVVEPPEQCDDDTEFCRDCQACLPPRTTIKWLFNADAAEGFVQDACTDLGVVSVRVDLDGPSQVTLDDTCSTRQVVFDGLTPGIYTASMTPLDSDEESLVADPVTAQITVAAAVCSSASEETIVIPPEAWLGPYTGSFFFHVLWNGQSCAAAGVVTERVTLTVDGTVVSQSTTDGLPLNGSASGACQSGGIAMPQTALLVPFGRAEIEIVGFDSTVTEVFRGTFDTFVGAGPSNPTLAFDVLDPADCESYCTEVEDNCTGVETQYGSHAACLAACASFPPGAIGETSGNSLECRDYHAGNAASDATTHCVHAGPGGADVCGSNCEGFCEIVLATCTGGNEAYATLGDCMTACAAFTDTEKYDVSDAAGDTLACRLYHATLATGDPAGHCGHTEPVSSTCQ